MEKNPHGDLPREEAKALADLRAQEGWTVNFKFTCEQCGERMMLSDPNTLYEYGECCLCGHRTRLDMVGFMLSRRMR